jgi:hypothetical protein
MSTGFIVFISITSTLYFYYTNKKNRDLLPPRAPGYLPVIGHLLQLAKPIAIQNIFLEWAHQMGPIFTCHFGVQTWVVLNSSKAVRELIVERGKIYSSRNLPSVLVDDLFGGSRYRCLITIIGSLTCIMNCS